MTAATVKGKCAGFRKEDRYDDHNKGWMNGVENVITCWMIFAV